MSSRRDPRLFLAEIVARSDRALGAVGGRGADDFSADQDAVDVAVLSVQIIGEAAKQVPQHVRDRAPSVAWTEAARLRDRLVHRYWDVNAQVVWRVVTRELPALRDDVVTLLAALDAESPPPAE